MPVRFRFLPALVVIGLVVSACSGVGGGTLSAFASPSEASLPSLSPTGTPPQRSPDPSTPPDGWVAPVIPPPAGVLPPGSVAVVTVNGVRVRAGHPGLGSSDDEVLGSLDAGTQVTVGWSPFSYLSAERSPDGRAWYAVQAGGRVPAGGELLSGWVAAGDTGLEFLRIEPTFCPAKLNLDALLWTPPHNEEAEGLTTSWDRLACAGGRSLELEGVFEVCYEGGHYPYTFKPDYLASPDNCASLILDGSQRAGSLPIGIPPALTDTWPERGDLLRVTGHFDDPASVNCAATPDGDFETSVDPAFLGLFCRERFVIEALHVIGHRDLPSLP